MNVEGKKSIISGIVSETEVKWREEKDDDGRAFDNEHLRHSTTCKSGQTGESLAGNCAKCCASLFGLFQQICEKLNYIEVLVTQMNNGRNKQNHADEMV